MTAQLSPISPRVSQPDSDVLDSVMRTGFFLHDAKDIFVDIFIDSQFQKLSMLIQHKHIYERITENT